MNENAEYVMTEQGTAAFGDIIELLAHEYGEMTLAEACGVLEGVEVACRTLEAITPGHLKLKDLYVATQAMEQALAQTAE